MKTIENDHDFPQDSIDKGQSGRGKRPGLAARAACGPVTVVALCSTLLLFTLIGLLASQPASRAFSAVNSLPSLTVTLPLTLTPTPTKRPKPTPTPTPKTKPTPTPTPKTRPTPTSTPTPTPASSGQPQGTPTQALQPPNTASLTPTGANGNLSGTAGTATPTSAIGIRQTPATWTPYRDASSQGGSDGSDSGGGVNVVLIAVGAALILLILVVSIVIVARWFL